MKFPSGFLQKRIRRKILKTRSLDMHCYNCTLHTTLPFQILKKKILCFWLKNFDRLIMAFPFSMIPFMNLVCERILWTERCKELERDKYQRRSEQMTSWHDQGCLWRRVRRRPKTDMDKEQFEDNLLVNTLTKKLAQTWLPHARLWAAIMMDFIPDAHTLLMVVHGVDIGKPGNHHKKCYSSN